MAAELLDLVALGTVADVVPFDANNRILVAQGLARIPRRTLRARHHGAAGSGTPQRCDAGRVGPGVRRWRHGSTPAGRLTDHVDRASAAC